MVFSGILVPVLLDLLIDFEVTGAFQDTPSHPGQVHISIWSHRKDTVGRQAQALRPGVSTVFLAFKHDALLRTQDFCL